MFPPALLAAEKTWNGSTSTNFELGDNWDGGTAPANSTATDTALFTGTPTANQPTLTIDRSIGGLRFGATAGWTLGGGFQLTLSNTLTAGATSNVGIDASALTSGTDDITANTLSLSGSQTWVVGTGGTLNVQSAVNNATLTIGDASNAGTLTLGGTADNASLNLVVNNGTVELNKTSTTGVHAASGITINSGGTAKITGSGGYQIYQDGDIAVNAGGTLDINGHDEYLKFLRSNDSGGVIDNTSGTAASITIKKGQGQNFAGTIQDTGADLNVILDLRDDGNAVQGLSGNNTFSGGIDVAYGTLNIGGGGGNNALGTGTLTIGDAANTGADYSTVNYTGGGDGPTYTNAISVVGAGTNTLKVTNNNPTFNSLVTLDNSNLIVQSDNNNGSNLHMAGGTTGTGNLILQVNGSNAGSHVTLQSSAIDHTGLVTNNGTGIGTGIVSANIGSNVTGVVQDSETSALSLSGTNSFTGGITIKAGTVNVQGKALGDSSGSNVGTITLGDIANTGKAATLNVSDNDIGGAGKGDNPINVVGTGSRTISVTSWNPVFSGAVTLNNTDLTLLSNNAGGSNLQMTGGFTGAGNLTLQVNNTNAGSHVTLSNTTVNNTGSITNNGTGLGSAIISADIGGNVTTVTQNSATSALVLSGSNSYTGGTSVLAGELQVSGSGNLGLGNVTVGAGATLTIGNFESINNVAGLIVDSASTIDLSFSGTEIIASLYSSTGSIYVPTGTYFAHDLNSNYGFGADTFMGTGSLQIVSAVPEPGVYGVAMFVLLGLAIYSRHRHRGRRA